MQEQVTTTECLLELYDKKKVAIKRRLKEFSKVWENGSNERIFSELVYCILTARSDAKKCLVVEKGLQTNRLFLCGMENEICELLDDNKYPLKNRAEFIVHTRAYIQGEFNFEIREKIESFDDGNDVRIWLAKDKNIKGIGYKEASHFLRNIGIGFDFAILDSHILRSLKKFGKIDNEKVSFPTSGNAGLERYQKYENIMKKFADDLKIPIAELDLILWFCETGKILK